MIFSSKKIAEISYINQFLEEDNYAVTTFNEKRVAGWGRKKSFFKAQAFAEQKGLKALCLEDGFIRSLGLGKDGYAPLSLVVDETGIYFDALQSSDLEQLILQSEKEELNLRATHAIQTILNQKITKYNQRFKKLDPSQFSKTAKNILIVDQTFGDQSIKYAGATPEIFKQMLKQACLDHPDAIIWVKTHPDVIAGKSKGHFSTVDLNYPNIKILIENYNPIDLLSLIDEVYVVSSQLGFEALMCDKKVHCFGVPWYAGWGLTNDKFAPLEILQGRRGVNRSLEHLFAYAYLKYARYVSPVTHKRCELEDIIDLLIPNIKVQATLPLKLTAYGFSAWKRKFIRDFLAFPKVKINFKNFFKPNQNDQILAWGKKAKLLKDKGYKNVITVEDGFIRSIGLGASLIRPCSLVFDDVGIYYDATQPSKIENLLKTTELTSTQYERAQNLRDLLVELNISKYNVGVAKKLTKPSEDQKILLVIGQVEDDMSVQLGGVEIKTNLALLKEVRRNNSKAYIIYKPHPDVHAGLRVGKIEEQVVLQYANQIELDSSILECFEICDEVHTITSLSGFEALLRGLKVYCYGMPFYAGWGLTQDKFQCDRRNKNLDLDTLVYVTLVEYAVYNIEKTTSMNIPLVSPEDVILYIQSQMNFPAETSKETWKDIFLKFKKIQNR
ncbi:capsular polysaccharide biosynthesis protein [Acinetobacter terrae]|uniref:Capsular polysaccharide biosynthesis protein n=1 Tax=Acinetobacter terrae TaxID=2731247 RepID=A0ABX1V4B7_9GAMM|nr:capsular polysaccharide biosynthesis protein [Acinetobacter terrae]NNH86672.1 capsular polysaccharide biosynthesis protein [Acinetobacter terrae]